MAKSRPKRPIPLQPPGPQKFPRLDGDHLYTWAQMIQRQIQEKQMMAAGMLTDRGYTPGQHLLTDDGYIITPDQIQRMASRSPEPVEAPPRIDQTPDLPTPDNVS